MKIIDYIFHPNLLLEWGLVAMNYSQYNITGSHTYYLLD